MKKYILALAFVFTVMIGFAHPSSCLLKVKNETNATQKFMLMAYEGIMNGTFVDSIIVKAKSSHKLDISSFPTGMYKLQMDGGMSTDFIVNQGDVEVTLQEKTLTFEVSSRENDIYTALNELMQNNQAKLAEIEMAFQSVPRYHPYHKSKMDSINLVYMRQIHLNNQAILAFGNQHPDSYAANVLASYFINPVRTMEPRYAKQYDNDESFYHYHFFDHLAIDKSTVVNTPFLQDKLFNYLANYSEKNPEGFIESIDIIIEKFSANAEVQQKVIEILTGLFEDKGPEEAFAYLVENHISACEGGSQKEDWVERAEAIKRLAIGNPAPDLELAPLGQTEPVKLSDYQGQPVILLFWASWCPHCMNEVPHILELYKKYEAKGLKVVAISIDEDMNAWLNAIQQLELDWVNANQMKGWDSEAAETYYVKATPENFLISAEGKILGRTMSVQQLDAALSDILK